jgi:hypothetical protein
VTGKPDVIHLDVKRLSGQVASSQLFLRWKVMYHGLSSGGTYFGTNHVFHRPRRSSAFQRKILQDHASRPAVS